jgi:2-oxo-4-hydroxy-4-carboxy-5-ureidoimidazoline decarboxylase
MAHGPLAEFNAMPVPDAERMLLTCAHVPRWAADVVAARPFPDVEGMLEAARAAATGWTDAEVQAALDRHPRIGEAPAAVDAPGGGPAEATLSRQEQSGVDGTDPEVRRRLAEGNRRYEDRFGHVFLIRAAGRDSADILAALEQRLTNAPDVERLVVGDQLREIAVLRLRGMVGGMLA